MNIISCSDNLRFLDIINYPDINIEKGKFTFITGPSGCGKSTFLKLLNATVIASSGVIKYKGKSIKDYNVIEYRKAVTLVPQETFLLESTIKENFDFYYNARSEKTLNDEQIKKFLSLCCIDFNVDTNCTTLSGGEKQRVFLAIYLSFMPDILLLDEPTSALDEKTSIELLTNIKMFCKENNITVLAVCHNDLLVDKFSDNVIKIDIKGKSDGRNN